MLKPESFTQPYVAIRNIPYVCGDTRSEEVGGVLSRGQLVWTEAAYEPKGYHSSTTAFVEEIGLISLYTGWLVRADILVPES